MQQWGDKVTITDVAELTVKHPLFKKATELVALQIGETLERNCFNSLMAGTQINYVNSRGSRASLVAGDVLDTNTVIRTNAALETIGAPRYMGDEMTNTKIDADSPTKASKEPTAMPHYVAVLHTLVVADFRQNSDVRLAWTYSDLNRLYNYEAGEWSGIRFCKTNMVPSFVGVAQINPTAVVGGGSFLNTNYFVIVTASDTQNQYESRIYQVSASTAVAAGGSMTVALPSIVGYTFNIYVGTTSSPANLALCALGPTSGPLQGQGTQLAPNQTVTITGVGTAQTPPAAPATGVTVYPSFIIGRGGYAQVILDEVRFSYLTGADKSDPLNQLRVIGWKAFYGTLIANQNFFARIESASAYTSTFG
jgi:hypothetical protein